MHFREQYFCRLRALESSASGSCFWIKACMPRFERVVVKMFRAPVDNLLLGFPSLTSGTQKAGKNQTMIVTISCFDRLSTNGYWTGYQKLSVHPELVEG